MSSGGSITDSNAAMQDVAAELLQFLSVSSVSKARADAVEFLLGLTGNSEGVELLRQNWKLLGALIDLSFTDMDVLDIQVQQMAVKCLINLSADESMATELILRPRFITRLMKRCTLVSMPTKEGGAAIGELLDMTCVVLSNLSRDEACAEKVTRVLEENPDLHSSLHSIVDVFVNQSHSRHHLSAFLSNISQVRRVRRVLLDQGSGMLQRLVPFIKYGLSLVRRAGVTGAIRNCCFETESHDWLLDENGADLLPHLLLPLAGPEEFDEEDTNKLPIDLQYLPSDKEREVDAGLRRMLVESINQLCATKAGRSIVHSRGYVILREYHRWEEEDGNRTALENLISVLISDEPLPEHENLNQVQIPDDVREQLEKDAV